MRYVVVGPGAVGGAIGGRLAQHGREVVLVARGRHREALAERGLRLLDPDGEQVLRLPVAGSPAEVGWRDGDVVVLAVKTQDSAAALAALVEAAGPDVPVLCAQNGVENERLALRLVRRVYGVCVVLPADHLEPGEVVAWSAPTTGALDIGCYPAGTDDVAAAAVADLGAAGFDTALRPDVMRWKYAKLLRNLGNALDAVCGPGARGSDLYDRARAEGEACLAAAGIGVASDEEDAARRGDGLRLRPVEGRRRQGSSSWQSLARGTGSIEADYLNGEIVLLGRLHRVPTPVNERLQRVAGELARRGAAPGSVPLEDLARGLPAA